MVNLTTKQEAILEQPLSNRIFLSGPAGTGKTTIGAQRLLKLLNSGISGNSILILTPQRTLSRTYETVLQEEDNYSGSKVNFMTIGSIARKIVDLFWPFGSEYGGFSNDDQPPVFLSLETAQYHMARIVQPLLEIGYFSSVVIDRNRLYSQILDNLNKAAFVGFSHTEIGARLDMAWAGESAQRRVFSDVQESANLFRTYCLEQNLLDYSLLMETFWNVLWPLPIVRNYLHQAYQHLIYDNSEEDTPRAHDLILTSMNEFKSSLIIHDQDGGHRKYLGADPTSALRLRDECNKQFQLDTSFIMSPEIENLSNRFKAYFTGTSHQNPIKSFDNQTKVPVSFTPDSRFFPQMLDWVSEEVHNLIQHDSIPPSEIAIMVPFLSDSMRFSIINRFETMDIPIRSLRPSRSLRDEPASQAILTFAKLCHPSWKQVPSIFDIAHMIFFCIKDIDLVRSQLLAGNIFRPKDLQLTSFDLLKADVQERITFHFGTRYELIRKWIEDCQQHDSQPLDHFVRRLFGELLSQPGYGFHQNTDASRAAANLIESIRNFRTAMASKQFFDSSLDLGLEYVNLLSEGVLAAQYAETWFTDQQDSVLLTPAHTFLMMNQPVDVQFWLDPGSNGWFERLNQPLTHPYVLSRTWETESKAGHVLWSDADELSSNQESLTRFVNGLLHRCRRHLYLGISNYSENGFEQQGILLKAFQRVFQSYL